MIFYFAHLEFCYAVSTTTLLHLHFCETKRGPDCRCQLGAHQRHSHTKNIPTQLHFLSSKNEAKISTKNTSSLKGLFGRKRFIDFPFFAPFNFRITYKEGAATQTSKGTTSLVNCYFLGLFTPFLFLSGPSLEIKGNPPKTAPTYLSDSDKQSPRVHAY